MHVQRSDCDSCNGRVCFLACDVVVVSTGSVFCTYFKQVTASCKNMHNYEPGIYAGHSIELALNGPPRRLWQPTVLQCIRLRRCTSLCTTGTRCRNRTAAAVPRSLGDRKSIRPCLLQSHSGITDIKGDCLFEYDVQSMVHWESNEQPAFCTL